MRGINVLGFQDFSKVYAYTDCLMRIGQIQLLWFYLTYLIFYFKYLIDVELSIKIYFNYFLVLCIKNKKIFN